MMCRSRRWNWVLGSSARRPTKHASKRTADVCERARDVSAIQALIGPRVSDVLTRVDWHTLRERDRGFAWAFGHPVYLGSVSSRVPAPELWWQGCHHDQLSHPIPTWIVVLSDLSRRYLAWLGSCEFPPRARSSLHFLVTRRQQPMLRSSRGGISCVVFRGALVLRQGLGACSWVVMLYWLMICELVRPEEVVKNSSVFWISPWRSCLHRTAY